MRDNYVVPFHCMPVLPLSDVSGFTAVSLLKGKETELSSGPFTLSVLVASLEKLHPSSGLYYKCFTIIMIVAST